MAVKKWSISREEELAGRVEAHVGGRGLSGFVARAVEHELEGEQLQAFLDELDEESGPVPEEFVDEFDAGWRPPLARS